AAEREAAAGVLLRQRVQEPAGGSCGAVDRSVWIEGHPAWRRGDKPAARELHHERGLGVVRRYYRVDRAVQAHGVRAVWRAARGRGPHHPIAAAPAHPGLGFPPCVGYDDRRRGIMLLSRKGGRNLRPWILRNFSILSRKKRRRIC